MTTGVSVHTKRQRPASASSAGEAESDGVSKGQLYLLHDIPLLPSVSRRMWRQTTKSSDVGATAVGTKLWALLLFGFSFGEGDEFSLVLEGKQDIISKVLFEFRFVGIEIRYCSGIRLCRLWSNSNHRLFNALTPVMLSANPEWHTLIDVPQLFNHLCDQHESDAEKICFLYHLWNPSPTLATH